MASRVTTPAPTPDSPSRVTSAPRTSGVPGSSSRHAASSASGASAALVLAPGDPGGRIAGLDGLRALAVLAVVVYHVVPAALPGGFLGVDVFFVVSGFLITTLLLREIRAHGRVDLAGFWIRRGRRLLPALIALILVSFPIAWLVSRDLTVSAGRQILGAATFTTNWLEIAAGTSYFDQTAPHLLKNLWSLAIEEQFYWLWPILLVVLVRLTGGLRPRGRSLAGARSTLLASSRMRMWIALGVAVLSMALMAGLVRPGEDATRVYYGTDTHLFGLALGVALAFAWAAPGGGILEHPGWRRVAPLVGIGALVALVVLAFVLAEDSVWTYRGGLQLANLLTAVVLAAMITRRVGQPADASAVPGLLTWFFDLAPFRVLGERSYGLYLWHWPVLVVLTAALPAGAGLGRAGVLALCVVVALALTELSLRFVERPVRRDGWRECADRVRDALASPVAGVRRGAIGSLALVLALVVATGVIVATAPKESETAAVIAANEEALANQERARVADVARLGDRTMPAGEDITAFGDSLVVTSKDGLEAFFPGIMIDAKSIRRWDDGLAALDAELAAGTVRRAVVVHFGTNAGIEDEAQVREFLDRLGAERMIVVVNVSSPSPWVADANAQLDSIVDDYPNAIVADWDSAISQRPQLLQSDKTHPDLGGAYLYAETVRDAFATLSERLTGTPVDLAPGPTWPVDPETGEYR